jgi:hypothetical protein
MTIRCPVCRADNDDSASCRRCKADLVPLGALERRRALALLQAARAAAAGDGDAVLRQARVAGRLRQGADALRWLAVGHLLRRDFARALACGRLVRGMD